MKKNLVLAALVTFALAAQAQNITFVTSLSGSNESPANNSPGTGAATVTYDGAAHTLRVQCGFSNLVGVVSAAHIHAPTAVPLQGNVGVATRTPTFLGFPAGVNAGTYDHTYDLTDPASFNGAFVTSSGGTAALAEARLVAALLDGKAYFNIHSTLFGGGEIRGFLLPKDSDADGVPDYQDAVPNSRDVASTIKIGDCDTGVPNTVFPDGSTVSDLICQLHEGAKNHGQFVSRVAHLKEELLAEGVITEEQADAIQSCAGRSKP